MAPVFLLDCSHGQRWPLEEEPADHSWWFRKPWWSHSELTIVDSSWAIYRWINKPPQQTEGATAKSLAGKEGDTQNDQRTIVESHWEDMRSAVGDRTQKRGPMGLCFCCYVSN